MLEIEKKIELLHKASAQLEHSFTNCVLCPRDCAVDRTNGTVGYCQLSNQTRIYKYKLHHGEEPPVSGTRGSGIVFFAGCTMNCAFCQNYPMSHFKKGYEVNSHDLAKIMLELQNQGAHNINLVTASHFLPAVLQALLTAFENGLSLPIVYNTNGYENVEILQILDGIIDIYLPDMKYSDNRFARKFSKCPDYVEINRLAVKEMFRQTGLLQTDIHGIAQKGLIIRHLLLPNDRCGTEDILQFITEQLDHRISVSLMTQYLPIWNAIKYPEIDRRITTQEWLEVVELMEKYGIENGWLQEMDSGY